MSNPSNSPEPMEQEIDRLDKDLLRLLIKRSELVRRVLERSTLETGDRIALESARIESILNQVDSDSDSLTPVSRAALLPFLKHISSLCLQTHQKTAAAYLGPMHSYSHLAAIKYFGEATELRPVANIRAVFESVSRGDLTYGVVPIENSTDGRVVDTLGMFLQCEMNVCGEVLLPIHHNLLSRTSRGEITEVHSKPQALSQCRDWLAKHLPNARQVETGSTTAAAQLAAKTPGVAAVASMEAGRQYDLDLIDANIEDNPNNVTRFAVLGRDLLKPTENDKTSILFQLHHRPGALADAMSIFKEHSLNLTWIESFPAPDSPSEYIFFVELTGHRGEEEVSKALKDLQQSALSLTVLGSYPKAE